MERASSSFCFKSWSCFFFETDYYQWIQLSCSSSKLASFVKPELWPPERILNATVATTATTTTTLAGWFCGYGRSRAFFRRQHRQYPSKLLPALIVAASMDVHVDIQLMITQFRVQPQHCFKTSGQPASQAANVARQLPGLSIYLPPLFIENCILSRAISRALLAAKIGSARRRRVFVSVRLTIA